jgi:hypothetical protein
MKNLIFIIFITILLSSCIDVIDLKVRDSKPHVVIEAILDATDSVCIVNATYSRNLFESNTEQKVDAKSIILTNKTTNFKYNFLKNEDGTYYSSNIKTNEGDIFEIQITDKDNNTYSAIAKTPEQTPFFLVIFKKIENLFNDKQQQAHYGLAYWLDSPNKPSFYKYSLFKNDTLYDKSLMYTSDDFAINDTMQFGMRSLFYDGDTILFQLQTINEDTYMYFWQVQDIMRSGLGGSAPYNPKSSFNNNALGYFCIKQHKNIKFVISEIPMPVF